MFKDNIEVENGKLADSFACFFDHKVKSISESSIVSNNVYNGVRKVEAEDRMFMDESSIRDCVGSLKVKNSEGFDRIPQRILSDGVEHLIRPLTGLLKWI